MKVYTDKLGNTLHVDMKKKVIYAKNAEGRRVIRQDVMTMIRKATDTHKNSGKIRMDGRTFTLKYLRSKHGKK